MGKRVICALAVLALVWSAAFGCAMDRDELRAAYASVRALRSDDSPYAREPDISDFDPVGELTEEKLAHALAQLNFIRAVAGLEPVRLSPLYCLRSQNAALLLAANDEISHSPARPEGMDEELYQSALLGASLGNLAGFNWMQPDILIDAVNYFVRDDGDRNLLEQGHRRWLLNPSMAETGFGLANAADGGSYIAMFAVDEGNADADWDYVSWPAAEAFPVELMAGDLAWSISLNETVYDIDACAPAVTLTERSSGARFSFRPGTYSGDGPCVLNREPYGSGACLIFRPELARQGLEQYQQNQLWDVRVEGLVRADGSPAILEYSCEMTSLYPRDAVNVELSAVEARLKTGEIMQLAASVIPSYADDLRVSWSSSDERVATVDFFGNVCAMAPGSCEIIAESHNGRSDSCRITVE